jgi:hypothetical protein
MPAPSPTGRSFTGTRVNLVKGSRLAAEVGVGGMTDSEATSRLERRFNFHEIPHAHAK